MPAAGEPGSAPSAQRFYPRANQKVSISMDLVSAERSLNAL